MADVKDIHFLGVAEQRTGITRAYTVKTTAVGTPSSPSGEIFAHSDFTTDLAATLLTGNASVSGTTVTTEQITGLTEGTWYRYLLTYTVNSNTEEEYFEVYCTDRSTARG